MAYGLKTLLNTCKTAGKQGYDALFSHLFNDIPWISCEFFSWFVDPGHLRHLRCQAHSKGTSTGSRLRLAVPVAAPGYEGVE